MKRILLITTLLTGALCASAASSLLKPEIFKPAGNVTVTALSDNGKYAVSLTMGDTEVDNPMPVGGQFITLETNTGVAITVPDNGTCNLSDIADDGRVFGDCNGVPAYWEPATGTWTTFKVPIGWGAGTFTAVTPDGKYAVGFYRKATDEYKVKPMAWDIANGTEIKPSNLPKVDLSGEDQGQNVFYGISPDGRYALGQMSQSYLMPVALFSYVYDLQENTWKAIGYDYNAETKTFTCKHSNLYFIDNQFMSCDGKWVTGQAYMVYNGGDFDGGTEFHAPYRYNIEKDELEIYDASGDVDIAGNKITSDGVVLACAPSGNPYPTAYVRYGKYFISLDQILAQVYNTSLYNYIGDTVTGSFQCLSADGLTAVMTTYDNCYIIRMPESFAEAASKVDLLGSYTPSIPSGTAMSAISEITINFDRPIACYNDGTTAQLLDSDGNTVRNSNTFTISASNEMQLVVTLRTTKLTPGQEYTLRIPAEAIWLKDDVTIKSKEINLKYVGRNEGAIKLQSVNPQSGAALSQFNSSTDYITATFDCNVAISTEASAKLYNADDNTVIATFLMVAQGNRAYIYPASTYNLYKGTNYKVVVAAGSVTDVSGNGGCDEITLDYTGVYVRELSADDTYIFNANCNSYDYFMMTKNQWHDLSEKAIEWGFSKDNIWMLLRESEESADWAMASHSMFAEPAQSDDWLLTPQLYIPDANSYLAFDAQSYLKSKNDVLRVYVYEQDAVINYLTDNAIINDIRENGDLVFEETLNPGESEESLSGDWTRYTVSLTKYAGKNIYIAFVNYNYDQSAIFLDNVQVVRELSFLITNQTPEVVINQEEVTVKGILSIANEMNEYKGVIFRLYDFDNELVDEIVENELVLKKGDSYNFTFSKPLDVFPGLENPYTIEIETGSNVWSYNFTVKDLTFNPTKKIVLEEFTGKDCGNCPLGIKAIEHLQSTFPDNFIAITIRAYGSDPLGTGMANYAQYLGLSAAPSARLNRGDILFPTLSTPSGYSFYGRGIIQSDGTEAHLWADEMQDLLNIPAEAEISFEANYDSKTRQIEVPCHVRFAITAESRNVNVVAVLLEDKLAAVQSNYLNTVSDPLLGEWGAGGIYGKPTVRNWVADDVARYVINGEAYGGTSMAYNQFDCGVSYPITISGTVPDGRITNPENCRVVVMMIDGATQKIINANQGKLSIDDAGIDGIEADDNAEATYYNLQGVKIANPENGNCYIRVKGTKAEKVIY